MEWVDLVTPALAVIGVFLGVGLIVQSVRHARAIRRLEDRLAGTGAAAADAPLQRLQELQQRAATSSGARGSLGGRTPLVAAAAVVALLVIAAGAWAVFLRDSGGEDTAAGPGLTTTSGVTTTGTTSTAVPADPNLCRNLTPLDDNALTTVSIFNASGIEGAARGKVQPEISIKGYTIDTVDNPPDGRSDLETTVVQFVTPEDRNAACNVARDLKIRPLKVTPLEGFSAEQVGGDEVNVVVLVGADLASG